MELLEKIENLQMFPSKWEILRSNGRTGDNFSKRESPVQNRRVGMYASGLLLNPYFSRFISKWQRLKALLNIVTILLQFFGIRQWCAGRRNKKICLIFSYTNQTQLLESWTKYLRQTLIFMWNSALRKEFNFYFSGVFY